MANLNFGSTLAGKIVEKTENRNFVFKESGTEYFSERVINSYIFNNNNIATLSNIKNASIEDLCSIKGINEALAKKIKEEL